MGVAGVHDAGLEQSVVLVDGHERLHGEDHEAQVVLTRLAWSMEQDAGVGGERPVVVLARTVDAVERLLVEQHLEAVLVGHALHERHEQHVVVHGEVGLLEDRSALKLVGGHLVVACLYRYAKFESLDLEVLHEGLHALRDGAEIVVVHLLVLGALVAHERASGEDEVGTRGVEVLVDEEILLLPSQVGDDLLHVGIEIVAHVSGGHVDGVEGTQQRCLVVEGLAGVGDEDGWYAERVVDDEHGARGIPCRVAARLEGGAYAA